MRHLLLPHFSLAWTGSCLHAGEACPANRFAVSNCLTHGSQPSASRARRSREHLTTPCRSSTPETALTFLPAYASISLLIIKQITPDIIYFYITRLHKVLRNSITLHQVRAMNCTPSALNTLFIINTTKLTS